MPKPRHRDWGYRGTEKRHRTPGKRAIRLTYHNTSSLGLGREEEKVIYFYGQPCRQHNWRTIESAERERLERELGAKFKRE